MKIQNIALITGGFQGLGWEWGQQLLKKDFAVILAGRNAQKAEEIKAMPFFQDGECVVKLLDVTQESDIKKLASEIEEEFGKLDLLINNAGVNARSPHPTLDFSDTFSLESLQTDALLEMIRINAIAPIMMAKYFTELLEKGNKPMIINTSSWLGAIHLKNSGGNYGYSASKVALNMMSKALAYDLKRKGIITIIANPGWVKTAMGGSNAELTPEESVSGMIANIVEKATLAEAGSFLQWNGEPHAW